MIRFTPREWVIYTCIVRHFSAHGFAPTMREIACFHHLEIGAGIRYTLNRLEQKGVIHQLPVGRKRVRAIGLVRGVKVGVCP